MMNRLKVGVLAVLVVLGCAACAVFVPRWWARRALADVDVQLKSAVALAEARSLMTGSEAARLTDALGRAPAVVQVMSGGQGDALVVTQGALAGLQQPAIDRGRPILVATFVRGTASVQMNGAPVQPGGWTDDYLAATASDGSAREGQVLINDALLHIASAQVAPGASVAVGIPVSIAAFGIVHAASGADVTLLSDGGPPRSMLNPEQAPLVAGAAARAVGHPTDVGPSPRFELTPFVPYRIPMLGIHAPTYRVQAIAAKGTPRPYLVLSVDTAPALAPVAQLQWLLVAATALFLVLGLVIVFTVTNEQRTVIPKGLVAAADRIAKGDFSARAAPMAGSLGTLASALNRAAEAASAPAPAGAASPGAPLGLGEPSAAPAEADFSSTLGLDGPRGAASLPQEPSFGAAPAAQPSPLSQELHEGSQPLMIGAASAPTPMWESASSSGYVEPTLPDSRDVSSMFSLPGDAAQASPAEPPPPPPAPAAAAAPAAADDFAPPAPAAGAVAAGEDEEHWQAVYEDFQKIRAQCGEEGGVPYERFRVKLQKNRDQLMAKYACRTVRFQVYVKEGKAALKASPVR
jgi:hypothetical protein